MNILPTKGGWIIYPFQPKKVPFLDTKKIERNNFHILKYTNKIYEKCILRRQEIIKMYPNFFPNYQTMNEQTLFFDERSYLRGISNWS